MAGEEAAGNAASSAGSGLTKKLGPLPIWAWAAVIVGAYLIWHFLHKSSTATGTNATPNTIAMTNARSGGGFVLTPSTGNILTPTTGNPIGSSGGTTGTTNGASWLTKAERALFNIGYTPTAIDKAFQNYLAGNKLALTTYNIIEAATKLVGHPPNTLGLPTRTTSPKKTNPPPTTTKQKAVNTGGSPPNLSATLIRGMQANGESIVSEVFQPVTNEWLFLTNKGGVYTVKPTGAATSNGFYGSIFALPTNHANWFTPTGQQVRFANRIIALATGGYTIVDTSGESYKFTKNSPYSGRPTTAAA